MIISHYSEPCILAVDLGLRTGYAIYSLAGNLQQYGSRKFPNKTVLRRAIRYFLTQLPNLETLVIEGGGDLATIWQKAAARREIDVLLIQAHDWREDVLLPREQRNGSIAKKSAIELAKKLIQENGLNGPNSMQHDAAEAILMGLWAIQKR